MLREDKKNLYFVYFLSLMKIALIGCTKKPPTSIPIGMSAKINNVQWIAATCSASKQLYYQSGMVVDSELDVEGFLASSTIAFHIRYPTLIGVEPLGRSFNNYNVISCYAPDSAVSNYVYWASQGSINFTTVSPSNIQGVFSFVTETYSGITYSISYGQFNIDIK
jgi:hypothetical protein